MLNKLLVIGATPPPFNGPLLATQKILKAKNLNDAFNIIHLDISDRRDIKNIGKLDIINIYYAIIHIVKCNFILIFKNPQVVYLNISQGFWGYLRDLGFILPSIFLSKKVILHLRGSEFRQFYSSLNKPLKFLTKFILYRITYIIILGNSIKSILNDITHPKKIIVIPNGIDYEKFEINHIDIEADILYLSSLQKRKGIFDFLMALTFVVKQFPQIKVTIAGDWYEKSDQKLAIEFIKVNDLSLNIKFVGVVQDQKKIEIYHRHKVFVFTPNEPEGLPWVILEAMSAGKPVVTTNQGVIKEVVLDGFTGFITKSNPQDIANKIIKLLNDEKLAIQMGKAAKTRIITNFSEQEYLKKIEWIFKEAICEN